MTIHKDPSQMTLTEIYHYARNVIKGRWIEAEPHIMKNSYIAFYYARDVIKGRWPEAEPYIMEVPYFSHSYARDVMKCRWPEAEPYIMKDSFSWQIYKELFIPNNNSVQIPIKESFVSITKKRFFMDVIE